MNDAADEILAAAEDYRQQIQARCMDSGIASVSSREGTWTPNGSSDYCIALTAACTPIHPAAAAPKAIVSTTKPTPINK
jgi:hypothetical protein